jgi:GTP-binding protein
VLTKGDKVKPTALAAVMEETVAALKKRPAAHPQIIATSSETKDGIEALRAELAAFANVR